MNFRDQTQLMVAAGLALSLAACDRAPNTPKLPDWSGVWSPVEANLFDPTAEKLTGAAAMIYGTPRMYPPYNAEWEAKYKRELDMNTAGLPRDPTARCVPPGMPRIMSSPFPWEFIVQPGRVTMLKEYQSQVRRIFTDGRPHPADLDASYNGHSTGKWEGDTLVIDTVGLRADTPYDRTGAPHSDRLHVTERMREIKPGLIEDVLTLDDKLAFTKPWVVRRTYEKKADWNIMEYVCTENNRNTINENGVTTTTLPGANTQ